MTFWTYFFFRSTITSVHTYVYKCVRVSVCVYTRCRLVYNAYNISLCSGMCFVRTKTREKKTLDRAKTTSACGGGGGGICARTLCERPSWEFAGKVHFAEQRAPRSRHCRSVYRLTNLIAFKILSLLLLLLYCDTTTTAIRAKPAYTDTSCVCVCAPTIYALANIKHVYTRRVKVRAAVYDSSKHNVCIRVYMCVYTSVCTHVVSIGIQ